MSEVIDILLRNVDRIKSAECAGDTTVATLETEAFQATLSAYLKRKRIEGAEYSVFYNYLAEFSAKFPS